MREQAAAAREPAPAMPALKPMGGGAMPVLPPPAGPNVPAPRGTVEGDTNELSRKLTTGSGISQLAGKIEGSKFGQAHPLLGRIAGIGTQALATLGDVGLSTLLPAAAAMTPGTEYHHDRLVKQDRAQLAEDTSNAERQAAAARNTTETALLPGKTQSEEALQGAQTEHEQAETAALGNPSFEIHDTEAGPLLVNKKDGSAQHLSVDGQPVGPKIKLTESQPIIGPDGQPHTYMLDEKGNKVVDLGRHYERPAVSVSQGEKNLWSVPQPDGSHVVVSLRAGDKIPEGAVSLSGQSTENSKAGAADAPTVAALKFANDYLSSGAYTGPSDEALQDQFFQMAKPSTGFRMNQAQISQLHDMASWVDSAKGRLYHAIHGVWFAPDQRRNIVATMNALAASKGIKPEAAPGGGGPPSGAKTQSFTDAGVTYNIPADQVEEFKRDHPHAR